SERPTDAGQLPVGLSRGTAGNGQDQRTAIPLHGRRSRGPHAPAVTVYCLCPDCRKGGRYLYRPVGSFEGFAQSAWHPWRHLKVGNASSGTWSGNGTRPRSATGGESPGLAVKLGNRALCESIVTGQSLNCEKAQGYR